MVAPSMAYATQADLEDAFAADEIRQLADRDRDGVADSNVIAAVLARADSMIDSYLGGRYALPITPIPTVLMATACDLARYWLYDDAAPERVRDSYEDAVGFLKDVSAGRVLLQLPAAAADASAGSPAYSAPDPVFSSDTLASY